MWRTLFVFDPHVRLICNTHSLDYVFIVQRNVLLEGGLVFYFLPTPVIASCCSRLILGFLLLVVFFFKKREVRVCFSKKNSASIEPRPVRRGLVGPPVANRERTILKV